MKPRIPPFFSASASASSDAAASPSQPAQIFRSGVSWQRRGQVQDLRPHIAESGARQRVRGRRGHHTPSARS